MAGLFTAAPIPATHVWWLACVCSAHVRTARARAKRFSVVPAAHLWHQQDTRNTYTQQNHTHMCVCVCVLCVVGGGGWGRQAGPAVAFVGSVASAIGAAHCRSHRRPVARRWLAVLGAALLVIGTVLLAIPRPIEPLVTFSANLFYFAFLLYIVMCVPDGPAAECGLLATVPSLACHPPPSQCHLPSAIGLCPPDWWSFVTRPTWARTGPSGRQSVSNPPGMWLFLGLFCDDGCSVLR